MDTSTSLISVYGIVDDYLHGTIAQTRTSTPIIRE